MVARTDSKPASRVPNAGLRYLLIVALVVSLGLINLLATNRSFAPEMYSTSGPVRIGETLASGKYYGLFDLNVNIREIRDAHIARMTVAPNLVILGASHWQEAHMDLLLGINAFNAHVHRDYYEDMLGMAEMLIRHDKLPKKLVISVRDRLFTPIADRKDYLWLPGVPYYRAMAKRLGLEEPGMFATLPFARGRELVSAQMLFENVTRWFNAEEHPGETANRTMVSLDTLLPDGSIVWSREHRALFTPNRAKALSVAFAKENANAPPVIDPKGVEAIDKLIGYLGSRGVEVVLAHPPFNPDYFDRVRKTSYMAGLTQVETITQSLAKKHRLKIIGSFDPSVFACDATMYIDAEHANSECLGRILRQLVEPDVKLDQPLIVATGSGLKFDFGATSSDRREPSTTLGKHKVVAKGTAGHDPGASRVNRLAFNGSGQQLAQLSQQASAVDDLALQQLAIQWNAQASAPLHGGAVELVATKLGGRREEAVDSKSYSIPVNGDDLALQQFAILSNARNLVETISRAADPIIENPMAVVDASAPSVNVHRRVPRMDIEARPAAILVKPVRVKAATTNHSVPEQVRERPRIIQPVVVGKTWPGDSVQQHFVVRYAPAMQR